MVSISHRHFVFVIFTKNLHACFVFLRFNFQAQLVIFYGKNGTMDGEEKKTVIKDSLLWQCCEKI